MSTLAGAAVWAALPFDVEALYRLSSRAQLRPVPEGLLAESPLGGPGLLLANPSRLRLVLSFVQPVRPASLLASLETEERQAAVLHFLEHCHDLGLLTQVADGQAEEDRGPLAHWEPHDLRFHLRSRRGRNGAPVGGTYHLAAVVPPEPAVREAAGPVLPLPQSRRVPGPEPSLTQALEARRSRYGVAPLALDELGELLYRTCRVTGEIRVGDERYLRKLYPSGGGLHSLEIYVIPVRCAGLEPGIYRYLGMEHALCRAGNPGPDVDLLLEEARQGTGGKLPDIPSVLLVMTTRFRRVTRKYQSLAYSAVLKEVGGLFQTLYLVATAMNLEPTAIGAGNAELFSRAAGLEFYEETSVGEMVLGGALR